MCSLSRLLLNHIGWNRAFHGVHVVIMIYLYAWLIFMLHFSITDDLTEEQQESVEASAEYLYGLIHARFILTSRGMLLMDEKFRNCDFGRCPRVHCHGQACLPVGQSDQPRTNAVKIFCPRCEDIYYPRSSRQNNILVPSLPSFPMLSIYLSIYLSPSLPPSPDSTCGRCILRYNIPSFVSVDIPRASRRSKATSQPHSFPISLPLITYL